MCSSANPAFALFADEHKLCYFLKMLLLKKFGGKKLKKLALILALLLVPCTAFGLQMMDETAMDGITGQSGVHIAFDDVQLFLNIERLAWIDCDGLSSSAQTFNSQVYGTCTGGAGAIGINNFQLDVVNINAIVSSTATDSKATGDFLQSTDGMPLYSVSCGEIPLFYNYGQTGQGDGCSLTGGVTSTLGLDNYYDRGSSSGFRAQAVTIDATSELPAISAGVQNNFGESSVSYGGIVIGVPTVEIHINSLSLTPFFTSDINSDNPATTAVLNNNKTFGTIYMEGITFTTLSGWMEIGPH